MRNKTMIVVLLLLCTIISTTYSQSAQHFNIKKKVAINGYDPASYFDNKPEEGDSKYTADYHGVKYQFSSATNKAKFEKSPEKYIPQYGGWCAYAMGANGEKVKIDPKTFKIVDGKLYLFYNFYFTNTLESWNEDEKGLKSKADINWTKIIK